MNRVVPLERWDKKVGDTCPEPGCQAVLHDTLDDLLFEPHGVPTLLLAIYECGGPARHRWVQYVTRYDPQRGGVASDLVKYDEHVQLFPDHRRMPLRKSEEEA